jgi:Holliday junction DNA helicase RuvA
MIASITGRLARKATDYLIVVVSGIGYQVSVPLSTYYGIPDQGEEVTLQIHTHLREDSLSLFGFLTQAEKDAFLQLMNVTGIGPKLALAVLSSLSVGDLVSAIQAADDSRLCSIPGVGKKTAARIILELKDRMKNVDAGAAAQGTPAEHISGADIDDAISALVNLGYKKALAEDALKKVQRGRSGLGVETLIREALGELMKR